MLRNRVDTLARPERPTLRTEHPHIVRSEGVHRGRPTIRGAGISVQAIVEQTRLGQFAEQIVADYDGVLTLAQVHDASSYFYEHQARSS